MLELEDKWIINKLQKLIIEVTRNIESYDLGIAIDNIYSFIRDEFCDWYIEMAKTRLYSEETEKKVQVSYVLINILAKSLKLLHPFMPFITSEIYNVLSEYIEDNTEIMISKWPEVKEIEFNEESNIVENLKGLDAVLLEANHDIHMLEVGPYPYPLKRRVMGDKGHLSNELSGRLLCDILHDNLKSVMLGHLSKENNYAELAYETVKLEITFGDNPYKGEDIPLKVARRDQLSDIIMV